ncbi:MAG: polysaccharide deacetylase family protein [Anaerolineae bacterium]|jgi:peptidoglycan/xylan/chitin deacetylase (PgdA/CDA1 family)|nr:polysaccharide deacetylase family protein [Anaerolineae bacterium]MBT3713355.1 polysaccharide deacetylase family protein [Anaerolineae bacterium]MBT4312236.1 polysaccharide deacetylase family protein [Anaerolineae bacterium]MBT4458343.1 polysaccharide deacetylase family protein [Anaerolineae bacterium]MBT4842802.1 polysaccharide deacetylase family protein [Anaerolineae bacterium]
MDKVFFLRAALTTGITAFVTFGAALWLKPEWLIAHLRKQSPDVLYSVETDEKIVALTIDDGPDACGSPRILNILEEYDAHATFFLITDHIPGNEAFVERMLDEGHELGNHLTSDEPSIALKNGGFEKELLEADEVLTQFVDDIRWVRPGSGWYNEEMLATMKKHDYQCALGNVYPYDPQISIYWFSAYYVLSNVKPGSVIVLHDYNRRGGRTTKALEIILPKLEERGYRVVTLSELAEKGR